MSPALRNALVASVWLPEAAGELDSISWSVAGSRAANEKGGGKECRKWWEAPRVNEFNVLHNERWDWW